MEKTFEQQYMECEKSLYLTAFSYLHSSEDAKDCVQEAALSAYRGYDKLRDKNLFKTWITRILINKAKDFIRKKRPTEQFCDQLGIFSEISSDDMDILSALLKLEPELSVYITLRFYNDMTYGEVSEVLKQPESTVKYRTKVAMGELKKMLEEE